MADTPPTYYSWVQIGDCKLCGQRHDLRMGVCFTCCDFVDGRKVGNVHVLWDRRNPKNTWQVAEETTA